jgi:hypothetical protein
MGSSTLRRAALAVVIATTALPSGAAHAASGGVTAVKLADYVEGSPQLGVDRRGGAVATWMGHALRARGGSIDSVLAIYAGTRRPQHGFAAPRRLSADDRNVSTWATAVGPRGDAAVAWRYRDDPSPLYVSRARPGALLAAGGRSLPGSERAREIAVAIDGAGRVLVAWLRPSGRPGCGMSVMVARATRAGGFGGPHRVSGACAHAELVRVAVAGNGDGAVAWRSFAAASAPSAVVVAPYAAGRFGAAAVTSTAARVGYSVAVAAAEDRVLVAWRDQGAAGGHSGGRVLAATVEHGRTGAPVEVVATRATLLRDVYAAMSPRGDALVGWQQAPAGSSVFDAPNAQGLAAFRVAGSDAFDPPETVAESIEIESTYGLTGLALYGAGQAVAGYEDTVARRRADGSGWTRQRVKPRPIDANNERLANGDMAVGAGDTGEIVAVWSLYSDDGGYYVRAAIVPPPAG